MLGLRCVVLFLGLLAGTSNALETSVQKADKYAQRKAFVSQFAGVEKSSVPFSRSHDFEPLGDDALLLWESPSRAYLLKVENFCQNLTWAHAIQVDNKGSSLNAKFDSIKVLSRGSTFNEKCRILEIRSIDVKAMKVAEKAKYEAEKDAKLAE
jgi:Family of unknown function (DUF6491)